MKILREDYGWGVRLVGHPFAEDRRLAGLQVSAEITQGNKKGAKRTTLTFGSSGILPMHRLTATRFKTWVRSLGEMQEFAEAVRQELF